MAATGNEAVRLSQLKTYADSVSSALSSKLDAPASEGTAGQVLTTDGDGTYTWTTVSSSASYTASNGITISGTNIQGVDADEGVVGVVSFASATDFAEYMGLS